jgi:hypothetical protein
MRRSIVALLALLSCSACIRATTTITVHPDGSGVVDQEVTTNPQALALLKNSGRSAGPAPSEIFGPEQAQKVASTMNVRFVSGEAVQNGDMQGYRAKYAFDDVSQIRVNLNQSASAASMNAGSNATAPPFGFLLERHPQSSLLTITLPEQANGSGAVPKMPEMNSQELQNNPQIMEMMKVMARGMFLDVSIVADGRVLQTNAPYVEGSRVTLLQLDFDTLLATDGALQKLQQVSDPRLLKDVPGVKIATGPKLTIEFAR